MSTIPGISIQTLINALVEETLINLKECRLVLTKDTNMVYVCIHVIDSSAPPLQVKYSLAASVPIPSPALVQLVHSRIMKSSCPLPYTGLV